MSIIILTNYIVSVLKFIEVGHTSPHILKLHRFCPFHNLSRTGLDTILHTNVTCSYGADMDPIDIYVSPTSLVSHLTHDHGRLAHAARRPFRKGEGVRAVLPARGQRGKDSRC